MIKSPAGKISLASVALFALVFSSVYGVVYYFTPQTALAAMAFVQGTTCNGTASPLNSTNFAGSVTAGNLIVVTTSDDSGTAGVLTNVTDTGGNTYAKIADTGSANSGTQTMWYARVVTGGAAFHVTITAVGGFARIACAAQEFGGFTGTATFDKVSAYATGSSVAPLSATSGTLTDANELVVGGFAHYGTASNFSLGTGYTNLNMVSVANAAVAQESKVVAATTAVTAGATIALSREWNAFVATFRDVSTGPPAIGTGSTEGLVNTSIF